MFCVRSKWCILYSLCPRSYTNYYLLVDSCFCYVKRIIISFRSIFVCRYFEWGMNLPWLWSSVYSAPFVFNSSCWWAFLIRLLIKMCWIFSETKIMYGQTLTDIWFSSGINVLSLVCYCYSSSFFFYCVFRESWLSFRKFISFVLHIINFMSICFTFSILLHMSLMFVLVVVVLLWKCVAHMYWHLKLNVLLLLHFVCIVRNICN